MANDTKFDFYIKLMSEVLPQESVLLFQGEISRDIQFVANADLHRIAASQAIEERNYELAIVHLKNGIEIVESNNCTDHNLLIKLYSQLSNAQRLSINFPAVLSSIGEAIEKADTLSEKVLAYHLKIITLAALENTQEAIETTLSFFVEIEFYLTQEPPSEFTLQRIKSLPKIKEKWKIYFLNILKTFGELIYISKPELCLPVVYSAIEFCLQNGYSPYALQCFSDYALFLSWQLNDIESGYQLAKFASELVQQPENLLSRPTVLHIWNNLIRPLKEPISVTIEPALEGIEAGLKVCDFMMAGVNQIVRLDNIGIAGTTLPILSEDCVKAIHDLEQIKAYYHLPYARINYQIALDLQGISRTVFEPEKSLPSLVENRHGTTLFLWYFCQTKRHYLFGNLRAALDAAIQARAYEGSTIGLMIYSDFLFYDSLVRAKLQRDGDVMSANQRKMEIWAKHAPMNFQHKYLLVEAERKRIGKDFEAALADYQQAKELAAENGFIQDTAIVNELLGKVYLSLKENGLGKKLIAAAYEGYIAWGAIAVAERLAIEFPSLVSNTVQARDAIDLPEQWIAVNFARDVGSVLEECRITYFRLSKTLVLDFPSNDLMLAAWRQDARKMVKAAKAIGDLVQYLKLTSPEASWEPFSVSKFKPF